ncbi:MULTISPECIES: MltA domain-containing protein [Chromohalobacter]|nr:MULTISPECIES: MltA domain-containing protein [Chromohalobacter]MCI0509503.1 MltA domain-containing protein [Chromohalobacter sp.]MCI0592603.1 MltA domain-containing protein [Chromohalobacter sp.]
MPLSRPSIVAHPVLRPLVRMAWLLPLLVLGACSSQPRAPSTPPPATSEHMQPMAWQALPGWRDDNVIAAWSAFLASCSRLEQKPRWASVCSDAKHIDPLNDDAITRFFEARFQPYRLLNDDGSATGTITGYYEPILNGSRTRHGPYQTPLYRFPDAWQAAPHRVRAEQRTLLDSGALRGQELVWVDDPVEAAFLQIQGSGRVRLDKGGTMRVAFAGSNNQPFRSFNRALIERGEIDASQATLPGVKAWARRHPERVEDMLTVNPRMVFFRELGSDHSATQGPIGALGVPLTAKRSLAVDPSRIPLGAPVFLSTTQPLSRTPLRQLMVAQDTGSAIQGTVRADFYWGHGEAAGERAARMKQDGRLWVLMPK